MQDHAKTPLHIDSQTAFNINTDSISIFKYACLYFKKPGVYIKTSTLYFLLGVLYSNITKAFETKPIVRYNLSQKSLENITHWRFHQTFKTFLLHLG